MWVLALLACGGTEYGFSEVVGPDVAPDGVALQVDAPAEEPVQAVGEPEAIVWRSLPADQVTEGSSVQTRVVPGQPLREDSFQLGKDAPTLTDVLFVVDNSISMRVVLDSVQDGFDALTAEGVFPARTRIAVTGTTPMDRDLRSPHRSVRLRDVVRHDPGFRGLVDGQRLQAFREAMGEGIRERMPLPGCGAWFAPTETVPGMPGVTCLTAHTQIAETPHGVEAGLVSFNMLRVQQPDLFRPGASINVVFVSDTHDPGIAADDPGYDELITLRPDAVLLAEQLTEDFDAAAVRFHAIAPASDCTQEPWTGDSYYAAAEATGGQMVDVCTATPADYVALAKRIAEVGSRPTQPVVSLSAPAEEVDSVQVDGQSVGFSIGASGRALLLDGALSDRTADVRVRYRAATAPTSARHAPASPPAGPVGRRR